ncbi:MAG: hypothetical protein HQL37_08040 [Alphaproteobacteria bacterium]|nr:hypothetical protein [Alphaproteobacteria bacterium]
MIDWASVAMAAASNLTSKAAGAAGAANTNAAPTTTVVPPKPAVPTPVRPAPPPPAAVPRCRVVAVHTHPASITHPVPSFFQVFEDHGLDGLIPEDCDEAVRLWLGRRDDGC